MEREMKKLRPEPMHETGLSTNPDLYRDLEIDTLARTIWGEARGEGTTGMHAVANVIMNRVRISKENEGYWWGNNVIRICQKPYQFSCWNKGDPNREKVMHVTEEQDVYFASAMRIARRAIHAKLEDLTQGADHYHAKNILPFWAKYEKPVCVIGNHIFYKLT